MQKKREYPPPPGRYILTLAMHIITLSYYNYRQRRGLGENDKTASATKKDNTPVTITVRRRKCELRFF